MDDETFITHLLNSLPQAEYEGAILVIKERLRGSTCNLAQVEQLWKTNICPRSIKGLGGRRGRLCTVC